ncbi:hypothetical protein [Sulfuricurvum sp.]|uniref:hypothetical protein n=1 Tax=Sulfuricurvum sp. TaxID=2025608 RepID=UPI003BAE5BA8
MLDTIRKAQKQFQEIHNLLSNPGDRNNDYFTKLSIATEEAYVLMNEGMCANTTVCHECSEHRDFIRTMLDVLGNLEIDNGAAELYADKLTQYANRVNAILKNISTVLSTL